MGCAGWDWCERQPPAQDAFIGRSLRVLVAAQTNP
jgi:hypothetical protein